MKTARELLGKYTLLYIEDNREISEEIVFFLKPLVKEIYVAYNGVEGIDLFQQYHPDIVISDIQMPIMNGIEMIKKIRTLDNNIPVIITTAFNESGYLLEAVNLQVDAYLLKPLNLKELLHMIQKVIEPIELRNELNFKNKTLEELSDKLLELVEKKTAKLKYLYNHDLLTGLPNYINLLEEIQTNRYFSIILLDISNFSLVNKEYGKDIANEILKETGKKLKEHETKQYKLFKTESDNFVFLSQEKSSEKIGEFCEQLISYFDANPIDINSVKLSISFSCGSAFIQERTFPLLDAEYALENAKKMGSRYYYFYDDLEEDMHDTQEKIKWLKITQELIKNEWIVPYYQPIVDAKSNETVKYEVLARGIYNSEVISPFYFVKNAEQLGIITTVTRIIIDKSFAHFSGSTMDFSINLTQRDLLDKTFIIFIKEKLEEYKINPAQVTFEILENITVNFQQKILMKHLNKLKDIGFKIAIDDFGMDNSNFGRFMTIDFDYLKLDAVFIKNIAHDEKSKTLVSAVTKLAHSFGIKTIAEFIENDTIQKVAIECGVDYLQGYNLGKPSPTPKGGII